MPIYSSRGAASVKAFGLTNRAGFSFIAVISANTSNYNVKSAAISAGWDQLKPLIASVTINSGVIVSSTSTANPAFATGSTFPQGSRISLTNSGSIIGKGGNGGGGMGRSDCSSDAQSGGSDGSAGGLALQAQYAISINNLGTIGGGGGGGGGGGAPTFNGNVEQGGGGGGGAGNGQVEQTVVKDILLQMDLQEQAHRPVMEVAAVLMVVALAEMVAALGRLEQVVVHQEDLVVLAVQPLQVHLLTLHG